MTHRITRRTMMLGLGATSVLMAAGSFASQPRDIDIVLTFEGDADIPKGRIEVFLEDPAFPKLTGSRAAKAQVTSTGGNRKIAFSIPMPADIAASPTLQVVAQMTRKDGWLIARGSNRFQAGLPTDVTLFTVMY
ncbi:hypothetical protein [Paracoccus sp. R86501]|uniref:hypothetical protein n=1 Tax=Paracoccus sp. R86501 TaxID=3101711 RepID=UPI00366CDD82